MKVYDILLSCVLPVTAGSILCACSSDDGMPVVSPPAPLHLCSVGSPTVSSIDVQRAAASRAPYFLSCAQAPESDPSSFVPGTGGGDDVTGVPTFRPYDALYPVPDLAYTTVSAYLTDDAHDEYTTTSGYFKYLGDNRWNTTVGVREEEYCLFGYMPANLSGMSARIVRREGSDTWADGCRMTLYGLSTITPADVCVVVGVLKAPDEFDPEAPWPINDDTEVVPNLHQGQYSYSGTAEDNYVYLLLDHLYTNVNLELCVEPEYAALRTIVLKQVLMRARIAGSIDATIVLGNDARQPIEDLQFVQDVQQDLAAVLFSESATSAAKVVSNDADHPTSIPGYFAPGMTTQSFTFEFVYDVYDREGEDLSDPDHPHYGNLVRKDCHALNKWSLPGSQVARGKSFKVSATVRPTYLFMLSDPDLDNPTIVLETNP